jgi:hypothetical protein
VLVESGGWREGEKGENEISDDMTMKIPLTFFISLCRSLASEHPFFVLITVVFLLAGRQSKNPHKVSECERSSYNWLI